MRLPTLLLTAAILLPAQEFEVASIRPARQDGNRDSDTYQGRFVTHNLTLRRLIAKAWDVDESEISGGPNWIDSDSFDINAKIPEEYAHWTPDQFRHMLQSLLADRFQLRIHREPREVSALTLIVAKGGPKMTPAKPGQDDDDISSKDTHLKATNVTMAVFAKRLSLEPDIGKHVVDKTSLTGRYNFDLDWAPARALSDDRPGIFTALQQQLGLKLESARVSIQAVVIDRAEKPSDN